ncbi:glycoside hydrolase family 2 TIM barrel-domain containing protein [Marinifilum flexuosum]|uniref:glycoside hydrolase family 2 TIM barrel-domain containing protein n=1 Tax=Marinifilum flexuosum TaxID=1117708 RepID=UPI00248F62DE|nr:glycoside hydrolase family 2 TIM barrel-domain containing protein [Marinifilum flexuosum]
MNKFLCIAFLMICFACNQKENLVSISGRNIVVNDSVYLIKGICYHPVPKGSKQRSFERLEQDLALMNEAGINTIRLYSPVDDQAVLDQIHKAGIKIIVGFGYNQNGHFDILSESFANYINKYKSHPVILFWELGNEYNYHPEWFDGDMKNWYAALNQAAQKVHEIDKHHPVATAHGELPDSLALSICTDIDIWGMNVYRWDDPTDIFGEWKSISKKPMYLSEAGADSYMTISKSGYGQGENQKAQADATRKILKSTFGNQEVCAGLALFAFVDEFWKAGNPDTQDPGGWAPNSSGVPYDGAPNEEYWGIVDIERNKKEAFQVVKEQYLNVKETN